MRFVPGILVRRPSASVKTPYVADVRLECTAPGAAGDTAGGGGTGANGGGELVLAHAPAMDCAGMVMLGCRVYMSRNVRKEGAPPTATSHAIQVRVYYDAVYDMLVTRPCAGLPRPVLLFTISWLFLVHFCVLCPVLPPLPGQGWPLDLASPLTSPPSTQSQPQASSKGTYQDYEAVAPRFLKPKLTVSLCLSDRQHRLGGGGPAARRHRGHGGRPPPTGRAHGGGAHPAAGADGRVGAVRASGDAADVRRHEGGLRASHGGWEQVGAWQTYHSTGHATQYVPQEKR